MLFPMPSCDCSPRGVATVPNFSFLLCWALRYGRNSYIEFWKEKSITFKCREIKMRERPLLFEQNPCQDCRQEKSIRHDHCFDDLIEAVVGIFKGLSKLTRMQSDAFDFVLRLETRSGR
jgi:hypothetical protein